MCEGGMVILLLTIAAFCSHGVRWPCSTDRLLTIHGPGPSVRGNKKALRHTDTIQFSRLPSNRCRLSQPPSFTRQPPWVTPNGTPSIIPVPEGSRKSVDPGGRPCGPWSSEDALHHIRRGASETGKRVLSQQAVHINGALQSLVPKRKKTQLPASRTLGPQKSASRRVTAVATGQPASVAHQLSSVQRQRCPLDDFCHPTL